MIITLSGLPGAGKSTVKSILAEKLGLKEYSMGDLRGTMALKRNMNIEEFNALSMTDPSIDTSVDEFQTYLGETEDDFIIDSLLSWHFIPKSFKVFFTIEPRVAAERIFNARATETGRDDEPAYKTIEQAQEIIGKRMEQNDARYKKWYGFSFQDPKNFNLVLDTTHLTPTEVADAIIKVLPAKA